VKVGRNPKKLSLTTTQTGVVKLQAELDYVTRRLDYVTDDLKRTCADRDRYRKIASTHEVKLPDPQKSRVEERQVWKGRRYRGTPPRPFWPTLPRTWLSSRETISLSPFPYSGKGGWAAHLKEHRYKTEYISTRYGGWGARPPQ